MSRFYIGEDFHDTAVQTGGPAGIVEAAPSPSVNDQDTHVTLEEERILGVPIQASEDNLSSQTEASFGSDVTAGHDALQPSSYHRGRGSRAPSVTHRFGKLVDARTTI